jgi:hypothetical protein
VLTVSKNRPTLRPKRKRTSDLRVLIKGQEKTFHQTRGVDRTNHLVVIPVGGPARLSNFDRAIGNFHLAVDRGVVVRKDPGLAHP